MSNRIRKRKSGLKIGETGPIRVEKNVARKIKAIAAMTGIDVAELVTPMIEETVNELFRKTLAEQTAKESQNGEVHQ